MIILYRKSNLYIKLQLKLNVRGIVIEKQLIGFEMVLSTSYEKTPQLRSKVPIEAIAANYYAKKTGI
ncbi:MAG: hypothetical protein JO080_08050 [Mucilaginibacter sp.]|nr:hypothetical protein [Mucilaginibacter sp.]